ncbi:hypothetical protein HY993_01545 [Candidatus Micrarchaeota archaeon]|nr:hypothetical protein [Candidatus Micrarchaeota archaeon]
MIGNKNFSLEFLNRVFANKPGFSVIPYRRYSSPKEFRKNHFPPNTPRLLIRTNLDLPFVSPRVYDQLPRTDSTLEAAQADLMGLNEEWLNRVHKHESLQSVGAPIEFIVHPTRKREDFLLKGSILYLPGLRQTQVIVFDKSMSPNSGTYDSEQMQITHRAKILKYLSSIGVPKNHAENIHARLLTAFKELKSRGLKENFLQEKRYFNARFTFLKSELKKRPQDAKLEFYDFQYS